MTDLEKQIEHLEELIRLDTGNIEASYMLWLKRVLLSLRTKLLKQQLGV